MNSFLNAEADAYARHIIEAACGPISDDESNEISRDMLHEAWSGTTDFLQLERPTKAEREKYRDDLMTIVRFEPVVARQDPAWVEEQRSAHAPVGHAIAVPYHLVHMPQSRPGIWRALFAQGPDDFEFCLDHHREVAADLRSMPMSVRMPLHRWLASTATGRVRKEFRLGPIDDEFELDPRDPESPRFGQARVVPHLIFDDETDAALCRLTWC